MEHRTDEYPCPKCGAPARTGVILCIHCDYVLDVGAVADELPDLSDEAFSELSGVFPPPQATDDLDDPTD